MATVELDLAFPREDGESLASLLDALDRENAELRDRLVSVGAEAAGSRAALELTRRALDTARNEAREALDSVRELTDERDRERARATVAEGTEQALVAVLDQRVRAIEETEARARALEEELQELREKEAASTAATETALERLEGADRRAAEAEGRVVSLEQALRAAEAEGAVQRASVERLQGRMEAEERRGEQWRALLERAAEDHKREAARLRSRAEKSETQLRDLRSSASYRVMMVLWRVKSVLLLRGLRSARRDRDSAH